MNFHSGDQGGRVQHIVQFYPSPSCALGRRVRTLLGMKPGKFMEEKKERAHNFPQTRADGSHILPPRLFPEFPPLAKSLIIHGHHPSIHDSVAIGDRLAAVGLCSGKTRKTLCPKGPAILAAKHRAAVLKLKLATHSLQVMGIGPLPYQPALVSASVSEWGRTLETLEG